MSRSMVILCTTIACFCTVYGQEFQWDDHDCKVIPPRTITWQRGDDSAPGTLLRLDAEDGSACLILTTFPMDHLVPTSTHEGPREALIHLRTCWGTQFTIQSDGRPMSEHRHMHDFIGTIAVNGRTWRAGMRFAFDPYRGYALTAMINAEPQYNVISLRALLDSLTFTDLAVKLQQQESPEPPKNPRRDGLFYGLSSVITAMTTIFAILYHRRNKREEKLNLGEDKTQPKDHDQMPDRHDD